MANTMLALWSGHPPLPLAELAILPLPLPQYYILVLPHYWPSSKNGIAQLFFLAPLLWCCKRVNYVQFAALWVCDHFGEGGGLGLAQLPPPLPPPPFPLFSLAGPSPGEGQQGRTGERGRGEGRGEGGPLSGLSGTKPQKTNEKNFGQHLPFCSTTARVPKKKAVGNAKNELGQY